MNMDISPFKELVETRSGITVQDSKMAVLRGVIEEKMKAARISSPSVYLERLNNDDELKDIIEVLTVNETYFFREPEQINLVADQLVPELHSKKKVGEKIKILSAGCSTGEEAYSLAIVLNEKFGPAFVNMFEITGIDIDRNALAHAKKGIYRQSSFRAINPLIKEKYFSCLDDGQYAIDRNIRSAVAFINVNLFEEFPFSMSSGMDIIFYRNVSIYFNNERKVGIFKRFAHILSDGGCLFTSATETFFHSIGILALEERKNIYFYRKRVELLIADRREKRKKDNPGAIDLIERKKTPKKSPSLNILKKAIPHGKPGSAGSVETAKASGRTSLPSGAIEDHREGSHSIFDRALLEARKKNYDSALKIIEPVIEEDPDFINAFTLKASILVNINRLDDAEDVCLHILSRDNLHLECYLLCGLIKKIRGDFDGALKKFKKALYVKPHCWVARFYCAEIFLAMGDYTNAYNEYKLMKKSLEKGNMENHGLTLFPFSFKEKELMKLCDDNLNKLVNKLHLKVI